MMNYHITSKEKGQEIFFMCLILFVCLKLSRRPVGTKDNEDWELSRIS